MASTETGYVSPSVGEACALSAPPSRQLPGDRGRPQGTSIREVLLASAELAAQAVELAKLSTLKTYHRARNGALDNYSEGTRRAQATAALAWKRASDLKRDHPVRALAIVAGSAFLAGLAVRVWRSHAL